MDQQCTIHLRGSLFDVTPFDLRNIFGKFGLVKNVWVSSDPKILYGFVSFTEPAAVKLALANSAGLKIHGRPISVNRRTLSQKKKMAAGAKSSIDLKALPSLGAGQSATPNSGTSNEFVADSKASSATKHFYVASASFPAAPAAAAAAPPAPASKTAASGAFTSPSTKHERTVYTQPRPSGLDTIEEVTTEEEHVVPPMQMCTGIEDSLASRFHPRRTPSSMRADTNATGFSMNSAACTKGGFAASADCADQDQDQQPEPSTLIYGADGELVFGGRSEKARALDEMSAPFASVKAPLEHGGNTVVRVDGVPMDWSAKELYKHLVSSGLAVQATLVYDDVDCRFKRQGLVQFQSSREASCTLRAGHLKTPLLQLSVIPSSIPSIESMRRSYSGRFTAFSGVEDKEEYGYSVAEPVEPSAMPKVVPKVAPSPAYDFPAIPAANIPVAAEASSCASPSFAPALAAAPTPPGLCSVPSGVMSPPLAMTGMRLPHMMPIPVPVGYPMAPYGMPMPGMPGMPLDPRGLPMGMPVAMRGMPPFYNMAPPSLNSRVADARSMAGNNSPQLQRSRKTWSVQDSAQFSPDTQASQASQDSQATLAGSECSKRADGETSDAVLDPGSPVAAATAPRTSHSAGVNSTATTCASEGSAPSESSSPGSMLSDDSSSPSSGDDMLSPHTPTDDLSPSAAYFKTPMHKPLYLVPSMHPAMYPGMHPGMHPAELPSPGHMTYAAEPASPDDKLSMRTDRYYSLGARSPAFELERSHKPSQTLVVDNFWPEIVRDAGQLAQDLSRFGSVEIADLVPLSDKGTRAYVTFSTPRSAELAMLSLARCTSGPNRLCVRLG